ncbi:MAG: peptide chain release factor N(5)-glutamine methyltransferase [Chloroflexota bacterium]|nr:peptide chain release factor N(5)-glutamine methyltransferase [Chloroflexota bacterium]MDE2948259.1 peptide chain release factor N(5)-glutamine methyltransferase [Chloroflexota bacterium]
MTTVLACRREAQLALRLAESDTADLDAQTLLAHVLGVDRAFLFAHADDRLTETQAAAFRSALERRAAGEPIAYITGRKGFYDLDLLVSPAALIPRPETELLLEEALRLSEERPAISVADIGTGSGALAVTFARQRPAATVFATEICGEALAIARGNAQRSGVTMNAFQGDLAAPLIERGIRVDLLMANLPYIAADELDALAVSRFEPRLALDGGPDGLLLIRRLLSQTPAVCHAGAWILLEIGAGQGEAVARLVKGRLDVDCDILKDYAGLDRIARIRLP